MSTFDPKPIEYAAMIADGVPAPRYTQRPYMPAAASVWAVGPSESGKSIWALATACELSRQGGRVVYVSQENPLEVELRRLAGLRPCEENLILYHYAGFDLADPDHVDALAQAGEGACAIVLDTFTACWSGDENDNAAVVSFDRDSLRPVIAYTGATILTLDHSGHPQAFVRRDGVLAPRGASAKGQKADVVLVFKAEGPSEFSITHGKNRLGGTKEPVRQYRVEEDEDAETLELVQVTTIHERKVVEAAETIVEFLHAQKRVVGARELREALKGTAGKDVLTDAVALLDAGDPPRIRHGLGVYRVEGGDRRRMHGYWAEGIEP